jgi:cyclophilin family peptidyl-prolyl cis-trans isomerase
MSLRHWGRALSLSLLIGWGPVQLFAADDPAPTTTEKPAAEKAADEKPAAEKPADEKSAEEKPAAEKPAAEEKTPEKPAAEKSTEEKVPEKTAPAPANPEQLAEAKAAFDKVVVEWKDGLKELALLQEQYRKASEAKQPEMEAEFVAKRKTLSETVKPKLIAAAVNLYRVEGKNNQDVQNFLKNVTVEYFSQDRWEKLYELTQLMREKGLDEPQLDLFDAIAEFGLNKFDAAQVNIDKAAASGLLQPSEDEEEIPELMKRRMEIGQQIQAEVANYQKYWEEEAAFRAAEAKADDLPRVKFETTKGDIVLELFENEAPNTVANFISLVEKGYYDGLSFHRVLPSFMAQGGDPNGDGSGGPGYRIKDECRQEVFRKHFSGSLSMAKTAAPDTGGSQFFLTFRPTPHLNGAHTVFGRVIEGMDVLSDLQRVNPEGKEKISPDRIIKATVVRKRDHEYVPDTLPQ